MTVVVGRTAAERERLREEITLEVLHACGQAPLGIVLRALARAALVCIEEGGEPQDHDGLKRYVVDLIEGRGRAA
jgi:hypothetical protein